MRVRVCVAVLAFLGVALQASARDAGSVQATTIPASELAGLPPIVFTWGHRAGVGDLYVVKADGTGLRRIKAWRPRFTNGQVYGARAVAWSPDRRRIATELWGWIGDPASRMAVVSADGRRLRTLDDWSWSDRSFAWSHAGTALLFPRVGAVFVFRPATARVAPIFRSRKADSVEGVDWAPDDGTIVAAPWNRGLVTMTPRGTDLRWLTRPYEFEVDLTPQWSPRGDTILFSRSGKVRMVDRDGRNRRQLNRHALGHKPLWSPNGRSIVFTRLGGRYANPKDILVMRSDGRRLRVLKTGAAAGATDWSPDGSKILYRRVARDPARPGKTWWELWVMDANGGRQTRLPFNRSGWTVMAADWRS